MSDETYPMLAREHQADLERQATSLRLAAEARPVAGSATDTKAAPRKRARLVTLLVRFARATG